MIEISDPYNELADTVPLIAAMQHLESLESIVNACFHRAHILARQSLADGRSDERIALAEFAGKLAVALDSEIS